MKSRQRVVAFGGHPGRRHARLPERGRRRHPRPRAGGDGGQATVELALTLPFVALMVLAVVQVGVVVHDQIQLSAGAREAVRAVAVDGDDGAAGRAARSAGALDESRLSVEVNRRGGSPGEVAVRLTYRAGTEVPLVGSLLPDVGLEARATMREEFP